MWGANSRRSPHPPQRRDGCWKKGNRLGVRLRDKIRKLGNSLLIVILLVFLLLFVALCGRHARKKSSQKSTRPRGAKDVVSFPGAIGRNDACVRADARQIAEGGGATA